MKLLKGWNRFFNQRILVVLILLLQIGFIVLTVVFNSRKWELAGVGLAAISFFVALYVVSSRDKAAYKVSLVFLILLFPILGGLFYLLFKGTVPYRAMHKRIRAMERMNADAARVQTSALGEAEAAHPGRVNQLRYLETFAGFPVSRGAEVSYYASGEEAFPFMLEQIRRAEKYVFLEYFIIRDGEMWGRMAEALEERAAAGVDVRVIYDDMGCFSGIRGKRFEEVGYRGIRFVPFNRFMPLLTSVQNNRDHRKILSVDGKVVFTGGVNVGDEYINRQSQYGYWKDAVLSVGGGAAWHFTEIFLKMWQLCTGATEPISDYLPEAADAEEADGFVQPYADTPLDTENVGEHIYLQMINGARRYLYLTTPYLIIDDSTVSALTLAAKSGVDVRIITPYICDSRPVHFTTRSYYGRLIRGGVRVYEYSPGFMHAKLFVSDDEVATVGTANLDFRSLYLHFECGAVLYGTGAVAKIKEDFLTSLSKCREITEGDCRRSLLVRMMQAVMRLFAPLM